MRIKMHREPVTPPNPTIDIGCSIGIGFCSMP